MLDADRLPVEEGVDRRDEPLKMFTLAELGERLPPGLGGMYRCGRGAVAGRWGRDGEVARVEGCRSKPRSMVR